LSLHLVLAPFSTDSATGSSFSRRVLFFPNANLNSVPLPSFPFPHSMAWVTWTAAFWILVWSLLAYTQTNALCVSILSSLALSTNVLPYIVSIPLLVPRQASLGTAFGLYKSVSSFPSFSPFSFVS
jgi:hypothetical protein